MAGPLAARPKIIRRLHKSGAEILLPKPVHRDPRRKRLFRRYQPPRQCQPVWQPFRLHNRQAGGDPWLHFFPLLIVESTHVQESITGLLQLGHDHGRPDGVVEFVPLLAHLLQCLDSSQMAFLREGRAVEIAKLFALGVVQRIHRFGEQLQNQLFLAGRCGGRPFTPLLFPGSLEGSQLFLLPFQAGFGVPDLLIQNSEVLLFISRGHLQIGFGIAGIPIKSRFRHAIEKCIQLKVFLLSDRIEFVIVALRAGKGQSQPDGGCRIHPVYQIGVMILLRDGPALVVDHVVAVESRSNSQSHGLFLSYPNLTGEDVTSQLLDGELVKWLVIIESCDHPVPPRREITGGVQVVAVRVGKTRRIQPVDRHALSIARRP